MDHRDTHVHAFKQDDGEYAFYVMRKDHETGLTKITKRLIEMYQAACRGDKDARIKDLEHLADVCGSLHLVMDMDDNWPIPRCEFNPMRFDCQFCKGFKSYGICSHVMAINHILQGVNLRRQVLEMGKSRMCKTGGGNRKKTVPALTRAPVVEPDSSDEEMERAMLLGEQGK